METNWQDYKSNGTGKTAGSYLYLPGRNNDEPVTHAYAVRGGAYRLHPFVDWMRACGDFPSLAAAKLHAARAAAAHYGLMQREPLLQGQLF